MTSRLQTFLSFLILGFVSLVSLAQTSLVHAAEWQAGVAKIAITPEAPMWMSGYGGRNKPAEGTLHDLWAKAIVLQDPAGAKCVLIGLDLVGIDRQLSQTICSELQSKYGLERSQIALCTSHTHCGPVVGQTLAPMYFYDEAQQKLITEYTAAFPQKIVDVVGSALKDLEPVTLAQGLGQATFAVNRRENAEPQVPELRAQNQLKGPVDHDLPFLIVKNKHQEVKSVLFSYACHATTLNFYQWNGDWPGFAQLAIEKNYPGCTAIFFAGCGADQNPLPRRTVELAMKYGQEIATAIEEATQQKLTPVTGGLETAYSEIELPFSQLPTRKDIEKEAASSDRFLVGRAKHLLQQLDQKDQLDATYPYPIQTWRIGEIVIIFLGGEVVVDYALRIKGDLSHPHVWVSGYSNDVMAYIPSRRVLLEGGYEGARSMIYYGLPTTWAPQLETMIMNQVVEMVEKQTSSQN